MSDTTGIVIHEKWIDLTDETTILVNARYIELYERLSAVVMLAGSTGVDNTTITNAVFNVHVKLVKAMKLNEGQIAEVALLFAKAVLEE